MGYKVELHNLAFDGLIPAIAATGNIDMAIAGMTINEDRKKQVNFSVPYYTSGLIILVNPDNNEVKSLDDLKGKRIGVQLGTTGAFKAATVPDAKVVTFNNSDEQFLELSNKGVDACINDHPVVAYYLVQGGKGKMIGNVMEEESYGIALKKGNDELTKKVNDAIAELKKKWRIRQKSIRNGSAHNFPFISFDLTTQSFPRRSVSRKAHLQEAT